jgi:hypothetical protein
VDVLPIVLKDALDQRTGNEIREIGDPGYFHGLAGIERFYLAKQRSIADDLPGRPDLEDQYTEIDRSEIVAVLANAAF